MRCVEIEVTADDIRKGRPRAACLCPVALAIGRALKKDVTVGISMFDYMNSRFNLPMEATGFILQFDSRDVEVE